MLFPKAEFVSGAGYPASGGYWEEDQKEAAALEDKAISRARRDGVSRAYRTGASSGGQGI